jgi:(1->4)-alpha-D-glucan 1-alpha-D-glucosylmutase
MTLRATYRVQLRCGVTFNTLVDRLDYLSGLGISHLYLSPIQTATQGSTHGYDITDPTQVDPVLGGREGYSRLAAAAQARGMGIILDIVPNHLSMSLENPWLRDVLRHGDASRFAGHFDIDWRAGRLVLPFLTRPFEEMLADGALTIDDTPDGAVLRTGDIAVPLAPGPLPVPEGRADPETIRALHAAQPWRLAHWELERDGVTHRRFFNITGLIGMRVEQPEVWDDVHALILSLVDADEVQGLRVDHVDGLADPAGYLARLKDRTGLPVWVEKILTGDEDLPRWPVEGTTGYEAARRISQVLTDAGGVARLDAMWRDATGRQGSFHDALMLAKGQVVRQDLAAELHQLIGLARTTLDPVPGVEPGDEALREAVLALLSHFSRYRTYFTAEGCAPGDDALLRATADAAAPELRSDATLRALATAIAEGSDPAAQALRTRFQQVTGALLAKSHEDTAAFRFNRYLAANEVGAEPDDPALTPAAFGAWVARRARDWPGAITLASSHDTKRSADARARLIACSHLPEAFGTLWQASQDVDGVGDIDPNLRWFIVQSLLAVWEPGLPDLPERLSAHVEKAMREAKEETNWPHPDAGAERPATRWAARLARRWAGALPGQGAALLERADALILMQAALHLAMPGIPDLYQGTEGLRLRLTDPDNRDPADWDALARLDRQPGLSGDKARLTRAILAARAARPEVFAGDAAVTAHDRGLRLTRGGGAFWLEIDATTPARRGDVWPPPDLPEGPVGMGWG